MTLEPQPDAPADAPMTAPVPGTVASLATEPSRASGRGWLIALLVVSGVLVVGLAAFSAYLWNVHSQYVAQNEELRVAADTLGSDVAAARAHAEDVQAQLDDTSAQLETAKDTINGLANSEAQAGDDKQALVDVAASLKECSDARQDLINHLKEASRWTPESLRSREAAITTFCNDVAKSYKEIIDG